MFSNIITLFFHYEQYENHIKLLKSECLDIFNLTVT